MPRLLHRPLEDHASRNADRIAAICQNRRLSYGELEREANRLARHLIAHGVSRGDRVVIQLETCFESLVAIYGVLKAGGVFVLVHPGVTNDKLAFILADCEARGLIAGQPPQEAVAGRLSCILIVGASAPVPPRCGRDWQSLQAQPPTAPEVPVEETDLCSLIYTSGSTGIPKGVMLTHLNMRSAAASIIEYLENRPDDVVLTFSPLSFDYGLYNCLMPIEFGGQVVLERAVLHPAQVAGLVRRHRVTGLAVVPPTIAMMLKSNNPDDFDLPSLRYVTTTGQALPPEHSRRLRDLLPTARIYSMYGLTECKRVSYLAPDELERRPTSVGKPMPNVEVTLVDAAGHPVTAPGAVGELVVRGPNVMQGYWNAPEETARRLKPGAVSGEFLLLSGDLFTRDAEGFLYFVARKDDDLIKAGGQRISPQEVENALCKLPDVAEAAAVGVPHETLGLALAAFVVLAPGQASEPDDILKRCAAHLDRHLLPKVLEIVPELPRTTTGKIDKKTLQQRPVCS